MKALFKKDLRENLVVGLVAMGIFSLFLVLYGRDISKGPVGDQPLLSGGLTEMMTFLCGLYGAILGWIQSRNEANRDLLAFLIHRPITRTQIFWSKTAAGLCLYFVASGLPLLALIGYCATPGHVAAPFEPAMALPALCLLLLGLPYYFAGLLTGLRQARWYGSRAFGLGAALLSTQAITSITDFRWAFLSALFWTLALAVAVWGAYQSGGFYRGQPRAAKCALTLSLLPGAGIVLIVFGLLLMAMARQPRDFRLQSYMMTSDGQLCIATTENGTQSYTDLAGKPVHYLANGKPINAGTFMAAPGIMIGTNSEPVRWWSRFFGSSRFYTFWNITGGTKTVWYLDRYGKLTGFDTFTLRHEGDINAPSGQRFLPPMMSQLNFDTDIQINPNQTLAAGSTVYRVNLDMQTLTPLFTVPDGPIVLFAEDHFHHAGTNVIVATAKNIGIFDLSGNPVMSVPYAPGHSDYPQIQILSLKNTNRYAVWFYPDFNRNEKTNASLRERVVWIADDGKVVRAIDLPDLVPQKNNQTPLDRFEISLVPPILHFRLDHGRVEFTNWDSFWPAAICALIAGAFARRYRFSMMATAAWLLFILFCGIPGLLTFFAVQEWPKRETCPNCKKRRVVDREHCEHCAAPFPPPDKIGIEIFEPIVSP